MLYKFKSKAGADVIMLGAHGAQALTWLQKDASRPGIIEHHELAAAIAMLEAAIEAEAQARRQAADQEGDQDDSASQGSESVQAHQRYWPLLSLMRESQRVRADLVWGV